MSDTTDTDSSSRSCNSGNLSQVDRGWAWVICSVCCVTFAVNGGIFKSSGMIVVEIQERFPEASVSAVLWIMMTANIVNLVAGPLISLLINKTSNRIMGWVGVTAVSAGIAGTAYSPNVWIMYGTYGVIFGFGAGVLSLNSFAATGPYFDKKTALALGVTSSGSGAGALVIPYILRYLFNSFDFSSALFIFAGLVLHLLAATCLLRPITFYQRNRNVIPEPVVSPPDLPITSRAGSNSAETKTLGSIGKKPIPVKHLDVRDLCEYSSNRSVLEPRRRIRTASNVSSLNRTRDVTLSLPGLAYRDGFAAASFSSICSSNTNIKSVQDLPTEEEKLSIYMEDDIEILKPSYGRVLKDLRFYILGTAIFFHVCGYSISYSCIGSLAKQRKVAKETVAVIISVAGALEIVCRIFNGWLADTKKLHSITQLTICFLLYALMSLLCALVPGAAGIAFGVSGAAMFATSIFSLAPVAYTELFGAQNVPIAIGLSMAVQGVAQVVSAPAVAGLYEEFGLWEPAYILISVTATIASVLTGLFRLYSVSIAAK